MMINDQLMKIESSNTILYCKKWKETVRFYRDILALDVSFSNEWFMEFELNSMSRISVADEKKATVKSGEGKGITISLRIDYLYEMHQYLKENQHTPTPIKKIWGSEQFFVFDPEGNRVEFWSEKNI